MDTLYGSICRTIRILSTFRIHFYPFETGYVREVWENFLLYKANITVGALMLPESRIIASLLIRDADPKGWTQAIERDNVLQKRSVGSASRVANLIRSRLLLTNKDLWDIVAHGSVTVATQALLVAAVKHSELLADFMDHSLRDLYKRLERTVEQIVWDEFLQDCRSRDLDMPNWSEVTRLKLRQTVFQILSEAEYLSDTSTRILQYVEIAPEIRTYLQHENEHRVLNCLEICR